MLASRRFIEDTAIALPSEILPEHHKHCDDLFAVAEDLVQKGDWAAAAKAFVSANETFDPEEVEARR